MCVFIQTPACAGPLPFPTQPYSMLEPCALTDPPPTPPPPKPPYMPPIPDLPIVPGGAFVCNPKSLPSATFVRDHSRLHSNPPSPPAGTAIASLDPVNVANKQVVCWRWDEGGLWPPVSSHQDAYEEQEVCGGISSREVRWEDDFRQSKLYNIHRSRLNDDTCRSANDGVCQDGGYGDARPGRTDFHWASPAFRLEGSDPIDKSSRWKFNGMEAHHAVPAVGQNIYLHAVEQRPLSEQCFNTGSLCTQSAFEPDMFGKSRPGRLVVTSSGMEEFNVGTTVVPRPFFTAESAYTGRNAIDCQDTLKGECADSGQGLCNTDHLYTLCANSGEGICSMHWLRECSQNMWATGASDPANCPYGTE